MDLSKSLRMEDILSILAERLKQLVPYDCLAIYVRERSILKARYTSGLTSQIFASLEIPGGPGPFRMGSGEREGDHQRQSQPWNRATPRRPANWAL